MANEQYDSDCDVSRFLNEPMLETPMAIVLEPLTVPVVPQPVPAIHVQPHQVPTVHVQPHQTPPIMHVQPHPVPTIHAQHPQAPAVQIQHQQTLARSPAYGLHDHMLMPAVGNEDLFAHFPVSASPSLYDEFMEEGELELAALLRSIEEGNEDGTGHGGPEVCPMEEDVVFVTFSAGQLQCGNCHVVREVKHESERRTLHFIVHSADPGTFEHAIVDRKYTGADGQTARVEMQYVDLRKRTHEWVRNFISKSVETLRNDTSGQLQDSWSSYCEAVSTNISAPVVNDPYMELEVDMLKEILSTHPENAEEATPPATQPAMQDDDTHRDMQDDEEINLGDAFNVANLSGLLPEILESSQVPKPEEHSSASATIYPSMLAKETERVENMSMQDTLEYLHKTKEDAEKELSVYATLKRQCRKNTKYNWAARRINMLNKKIMKLEQTGHRVGKSGLLKIKQKLDIIVAEKVHLYGAIKKGLQKERENNGDAPSGSNNDGGAPSGNNNDGESSSGSI